MLNKEVIMMEEWVTVEEASERIGVSIPRIYAYVQEGTIEKVPDPHRLFPSMRLLASSVDALAEERKRNEPIGETPQQIATKYNVNITDVYDAIYALDTPPRTIQRGERHFYDLLPDDVRNIRAILNETRPVQPFYDAVRDVALHQQMRLPSGEIVRVSSRDGEWGTFLHGTVWVPLDASWHPCYPIHRPSVRAQDDITFHCPLTDRVTYDALDFFYTTWGVENMDVVTTEQTLVIKVKEGTFPLTALWIDRLFPFLTEHRTSGHFTVDKTYWYGKGSRRATSLKLDESVIEEVKQRAKENGLTMNEWIEQTILRALNRKA